MKKALKMLLYLFSLCLVGRAFAQDTAQVITLLALHPFDSTAFTQGIELEEDGRLILSTGLYGKSRLGCLDITSGEFQVHATLPYEEFGEGITHSPQGLWQLTWENQKVYLRDPKSFAILASYPHENEGWGIAYDKQQNCLLVSDGSNRISIRSPKDFRLLDSFTLPYDNINELEYANGFLFANVWYSNSILQIDLASRKVLQTYDFTPILDGLPLSEEQRKQMDVLNGIAHIEGDRFYIAGKHYPVLLEVELHPTPK